MSDGVWISSRLDFHDCQISTSTYEAVVDLILGEYGPVMMLVVLKSEYLQILTSKIGQWWNISASSGS
ncbi:hypothetical protein Bca4012_024005 [Brassica carinata]